MSISEQKECHDYHIRQTKKMFRDAGFEIGALLFPRPKDALDGIRKFNRVPDGHPISPAWGYFPNAYMRDNWKKYYDLPALP